MGNYKFKLANMMPNAWFYKLKDSSRKRNKKKNQQTPSSSSSAAAAPPLTHQRKSYHFTRDKAAPPIQDMFCETPRKSSIKRRSTKRNTKQSPELVVSSVSAKCSCRATFESVWIKPDTNPVGCPHSSALDSSYEHESLLPRCASDRSLIPESFDGMLSLSDFIIDMENKRFNTKTDDPEKLDSFDTVSELDLPPIIAKISKFSDMGKNINKKQSNESTKITKSSSKFQEKNAYGSFSVKVIKEDIVKTSSKEQKLNPVRRSSVNSPGVKLRTNSPRIGTRKIQGRKSVSFSSSSRKDLSESFAVVKSSKDPQKDFKESMVEMIVENDIFATKDLEDLLACYLSLNSDVYHDLIIKVFKQIWSDIIG